MSSYDTIKRTDEWWVRVYCEQPMIVDGAVSLGVESGLVHLDPCAAVELATALLTAAKRALVAIDSDSPIRIERDQLIEERNRLHFELQQLRAKAKP